MKQVSRDFKGIWIPREIWMREDISKTQICLLAEIHSLDGENGCTASDDYLAKFLGCSITALQNHLSVLRQKNLIYNESKKDRHRVMKTRFKMVFDQTSENMNTPSENMKCDFIKSEVSLQKNQESSIRKNKAENKVYNIAENTAKAVTKKDEYVKHGESTYLLPIEYKELCEVYQDKSLVDVYIRKVDNWLTRIKASEPKRYGKIIRTHKTYVLQFMDKDKVTIPRPRMYCPHCYTLISDSGWCSMCTGTIDKSDRLTYKDKELRRAV